MLFSTNRQSMVVVSTASILEHTSELGSSLWSNLLEVHSQSYLYDFIHHRATLFGDVSVLVVLDVWGLTHRDARWS